MKNKLRNFSVKIIRGFPYVYSWSYRKKSYRSNSIDQRYHWKYRGRYGTKRIQSFMRQLNEDEKKQLRKEVQQKLNDYHEKQVRINNLLENEPFKSRYTQISKVKNRHNREKMLNELRRELRQSIKTNGIQ
ncbi:hypothetical protein DFO70_1121 [Cytobacillus firmus]|uniref:Uncharacterized protein n=2 Tax=Cytobacillus TaxID=2675230 RepID=A0A366JNQ8_CYTFI|nr:MULTISPECIES: hypothetical protein [Cytobacillus]RBP88970.1 hypothetical protein DFO70_1121 [Cytobacillus firmus]TDX47177.1 hypothetical protein DFO72_101265 [Cytobacillus oceanisediminis]